MTVDSVYNRKQVETHCKIYFSYLKRWCTIFLYFVCKYVNKNGMYCQTEINNNITPKHIVK